MAPRNRAHDPSGFFSRMGLALLTLSAWGVASCKETRLYSIVVVEGGDGSVVEPPLSDGARDDRATDANTGDLADGSDGSFEIPPCPPDLLVGFAATDGGTTGGGNTPPVTVTTAAELRMYANTNDDPQVIEIGSIIALTEPVRVKSNKTLRGTAPGMGIVGSGLMLTESTNVIVQRLSISKALAPDDAIGLNHAQNVWIDHCDLFSDLDLPKGTYDGLIDITHGSLNVTVSWTKFHDHYNATLVGGSNVTGSEDIAATATYHHNWFASVPNYGPRVRFGTVHVYNNLYEDVEGAVVSQMAARVFVEGNVFRRVVYPIRTEFEDPIQGMAAETNNVFEDPDHPPSIKMTTSWRPAPTVYAYTADPAFLVSGIVKKCAGQLF